MLGDVTYYTSGDSSLTIDFGNEISEEVNALVLSCLDWLKLHPIVGLKELVCSYNTLTLIYDPWLVKKNSRSGISVALLVENQVREILKCRPFLQVAASARLFRIPVCYGDAMGPDLKEAARLLSLSQEELVGLHTANSFRIYLVGYLPGFVYLGVLPPALRLQRKSSPVPIRKGSVAMAAWQTGIYPSNAPGGWHCIGRTPLEIFSYDKTPPMTWVPGDAFQFVAIDEARFREIEKGGAWEF